MPIYPAGKELTPWAIRRAVGVVLDTLGPLDDPQLRAAVTALEIPVVETWSLPATPLDSLVTIDNAEAGRLAARHLAEKGHARVACVSADTPWERARREGFLGSAAALELAVVADIVQPEAQQLNDGRMAFLRLLATNTIFDAVFCTSDLLAAATVSEAHNRDLHVPQKSDTLYVDLQLRPSPADTRSILEAAAEAPSLERYVAEMRWMHPIYGQLRNALASGQHSDEQADLNPDCQRYDAGADVYESLQSVIDTYWNYYIFNAFRRQRLGFTTEAYAQRVLSRYFRKLQHANQIYSLYRGVFADIFGGDPSYARFWTRPDGMGPWTVGVGASYQLLTQVVTAPEPGNYALGTRPPGGVRTADVQAMSAALAAGERAEGPCVLELPEATLVLPPDWAARVDAYGTVLAERAG